MNNLTLNRASLCGLNRASLCEDAKHYHELCGDAKRYHELCGDAKRYHVIDMNNLTLNRASFCGLNRASLCVDAKRYLGVLILSFIFSLLLIGCKSKNNPASAIDSTRMNSEGITVVEDDFALRIIAITDMENSMSVDLFKGSSDDSLLSVLAAPDGQFKSTISTFLIASGGDLVLVDAGLGSDKGGQLLAKLGFLGIRPEKITAVLLTHLHADHIGGLLNNGQPTFPNADIYLSVDEFNAWADSGSLAAQNGLWKEVLASYAYKVLPFVDGDTLLDGLAVAKLAPGHTPGHTVYLVGNTLFVGDLVHAQDLQIKHPEFCARYDGDYQQAVATRKHILEYAAQSGLTICGAHCYSRIEN